MAEVVNGTVNNLPSNATAVNTPLSLQQTPLGSLKFASMEPRYLEMAREGKIFTVTLTVAQAVAPLQVVPTTTAAFVLNHYDTTTTKCLFPIRIAAFLASGTSDIGATLFAQVGSTPLATQLTANGTGVVMSNTRGGVPASSAYGDTSKTVAGGWCAIGSFANAAAATPGCGVVVDVEGMFCVRPTYALGLHVVSGAGTTAKYTFSVTWAELPELTP